MRSSLLFGLALVLFAGTSGRAGDEPVMGGKAVGKWIAILREKDRSLADRRRAAEALGYLGPAARSAVPCLLQALAEPRTGNKKIDEDNSWLRFSAIKALGRIGPAAAEAVPKLFPKTGETGPARWEERLDGYMAEALGRIGRPAIPALIRALQGEDLDLRFFAIGSLGEMQDEAGEAVPALIATLDDLSIEAIWDTLCRIGPAAAPALPALWARLEQDSFELPLPLSGIGRAAVPALVEIFRRRARDYGRPGEDDLPDVRGFLALGEDAREAAPALRPYLTDKRPVIRAAAAVALGAIAPDTPGLVPALTEILKYPRHDPEDLGAATPEQYARSEYGREAALVLGWIGPPARSALPTLRECLKDQEQDKDSDWNNSYFQGLIGIMIRIDPAGQLVVPSLFRAIRRGDEKAMMDATMLEPIPEVILKALTDAAKDDRGGVSHRVWGALARIGPAAVPAVPALIRGLDGDDPGGSAEALGAIGPAAREAVPALERKLKAKDGPGLWALIALLQIDPTSRAAKEFLAREADSLPLKVRAILAGSLNQWSPEAEALTRETLFAAHRRNLVSGHDGYSSALCDPYFLKELGQYGPGARAAVPELTNLLTHRDRYVRRWAADALRRIEGRAGSLPSRIGTPGVAR
jgi:HEAT repeat protein